MLGADRLLWFSRRLLWLGVPSRKQEPLARALKPRHRNRQPLAPSVPKTELVHENRACRARALMPRLEILELMGQAQASYFERRPPRLRRRASYFEKRLFAARALRQRLAVRRVSGKNG